MTNTSRNPFSPSSSAPMAKKVGGGQKNAAGVPAAVKVPPATAASAGTPKKTRKSTNQKNRNPPEFSDLDSLINVKPPLRVLCHCLSPTHGEMLFGQLGLHFHNHPQTFMFLPLTSATRSLAHQPPHLHPLRRVIIYLPLTRIVTQSITRCPTRTHLHPLLRLHVRRWLNLSKNLKLKDDTSGGGRINLKDTFDDLVTPGELVQLVVPLV